MHFAATGEMIRSCDYELGHGTETILKKGAEKRSNTPSEMASKSRNLSGSALIHLEVTLLTKNTV